MTANDIDPALAEEIEEVVLFGTIRDFDALIERIKDDEAFPDDVRTRIETLRYFRDHYTSGPSSLSDSERRNVARYDIDWTAQLIQQLRRNNADEAERKLA